jgi:serine/threonine protein kinase
MKKITYETNLMKKLNHPNITKILELFEDKDYILIIMEYINGGNLFSFVKKRRKVSEKTAKFLFKQIILGIKHIHSHNIVHRDIKLENILIDLNNNIKICDFGIGRVLASPDQLLFDQCGTPMYIAPEILLSTKETGYKGFPVDIWSSGIALYILLSGTLPFSFKNGSSISIEESEKNNHHNTEELQFAIVNSEPKYIENVSEEARDLLRGLLNKNPDKRLTCNEILAHPWLKDINENLDNNKYHLFTKAEMKMLSKTYVDYRKDKNDNLKENFSLSNLFNDNKDKNKNSEKNEETKSSILAPFNSIIEEDEDELNFDNFDFMDDLNNDKILLENGIISIGHKVKEFNMLYEMNNNCEFDNGIIINSKTNSAVSESNNTINSAINDSLPKNNDLIRKEDKRYTVNNNLNNFTIKARKLIKDNNEKNKENQEKNKILNHLENMGYNKNYVKECIKNNVLCYASTAYFLMLNYDKI